jgi:antitoxin HicB
MNFADYTVIYRSEPEGGFTAIVPSLPGCVSYGKTLEEAKRMIIDAIEGYIVSLKKHNESIPSDAATFISTVHIHKDLSHTSSYA